MLERKHCDFCNSPLYRGVGPCPCVAARADSWSRSWLNLQPYAMSVRLREIQSKYNCTIDALAKMVNRIPVWVFARSALADLHPTIGHALDEQSYKQDDIDRAEWLVWLPQESQMELWDRRHDYDIPSFKKEVRRLKRSLKRV